MFLARKTFSDEMFLSLKVFKKKQIGLLLTKFFVTWTFSDGVLATKWVLSLKVLNDEKPDFYWRNFSSLKIHFVVVCVKPHNSNLWILSLGLWDLYGCWKGQVT